LVMEVRAPSITTFATITFPSSKITNISFTFGYPKSFSISVGAERREKAYHPPYLEIQKASDITWPSGVTKLYFWFESNNKNYWIVHFSWK